jgi:SAM-dependent MidA family methyltransferase
LRQEIADGGAVSFARFMEVALYCPEHGYYEQDRDVIGFGSEFYTSPSVGPFFGQLLGAQLVWWSLELGGGPISWIEAGAHKGVLATVLLEWLGKNRPEMAERVTYCIVEPSLRRQAWQKQALRKFEGRVRWTESLAAFHGQPVSGIIFSNELLDAFPVRRVQWNGKQWVELGVTLQGKRFLWTSLASASIDIPSELLRAGFQLEPELLKVLPIGFTIDISPGAGAWWKAAAQALAKGKVMTVDYGYMTEEFLKPERMDGTVRAYYKQRISHDVLAMPGEQDITAHVNFTQLQLAGEEAGLKTEVLLSQEEFLSRIVQRSMQEKRSEEWSSVQIRQFQTLTHPEQMGRQFRVFVQSR